LARDEPKKPEKNKDEENVGDTNFSKAPFPKFVTLF
jgi:hypothetical protein